MVTKRKHEWHTFLNRTTVMKNDTVLFTHTPQKSALRIKPVLIEITDYKNVLVKIKTLDELLQVSIEHIIALIGWLVGSDEVKVGLLDA